MLDVQQEGTKRELEVYMRQVDVNRDIMTVTFS